MKYFFVIIVMMTSFSYGCLWLSGTTLDGEYRQFNDVPPSYRFDISIEQNKSNIFDNHFRNADKNTTSYFAVVAITKGNYNEAISMLLKNEKITPYKYETAANLAVAYELNGDLENAIMWMDRAIKRNKDSHYATEWLHRFILQSKKEMQENKNLANKRLIVLPETFTNATKVKVGNYIVSIQELRKSLIYQLGERLVFVKPKDTIVSELLYTLAIIEANTRAVEESLQIFDLAEQYGFSDMKLIKQKKELYSRAFIYMYIRYGIIIGLSVFLLFYIRRYFMSKIITTKDNKIILNSFYSTIVTVSIVILFSLLGFFIGTVLSNYFTFMQDISAYWMFFIFYFIGLIQATRYMKQKNYVVNSRVSTIFYSVIFLLLLYLVVIVKFLKFNLMMVVPLPLMIFGLYMILKRNLPVPR